MNNDPENNDQLRKALKSYGMKQDINRLHREMMQSMRGEEPRGGRIVPMTRYVSRIAVAALILLTSAAMIIYFSSSSQQLFDAKYQPYEASAQRGTDNQQSIVKDKFSKAQELMRSGNIPGAIISFAEILRINSSAPEKILNDDAEYYLALAYLEDNQPENALPLFEKINEDENHSYHDQVSDWFLFRLKIAIFKNK